MPFFKKKKEKKRSAFFSLSLNPTKQIQSSLNFLPLSKLNEKKGKNVSKWPRKWLCTAEFKPLKPSLDITFFSIYGANSVEIPPSFFFDLSKLKKKFPLFAKKKWFFSNSIPLVRIFKTLRILLCIKILAVHSFIFPVIFLFYFSPCIKCYLFGKSFSLSLLYLFLTSLQSEMLHVKPRITFYEIKVGWREAF